jgi:uncharacterized BrkB/YihY/UPF0761 family membrane protein
LVLAVGFILVVSLVASALLAALGTWSASILPAHEAILEFVNFIVSFVVITGLFSAIYRILPDVRIEWRDVILGATITSALFTLGKLALGIYLGKATFASTYGAASSIVVLIVWVYYSSQIFFLGAEFTKTFADCYGSQPGRQPVDLVKGSAAPGKPSVPKHLETAEQEARKMPTLNDILESNVLGCEFKRGELTVLRRLIEKHLGAIPNWAEDRLAGLTTAELEELSVRVLDAQSLEQLLK